jgi:hypothetical protein
MEMISLSGRPQVTYVRPWYNDPFWGDRVFPYMIVGYPQTLTVQGYMFTRTTAVYVSANNTVYNNTSSLSSKTLFSPFSGTSSLTGKDFLTQFPAFSGNKLDDSSWHIVDDNHMTITLPEPQAVGYVDIIIQSIGGYSLLSKDLSGGPVIVRT